MPPAPQRRAHTPPDTSDDEDDEGEEGLDAAHAQAHRQQADTAPRASGQPTDLGSGPQTHLKHKPLYRAVLVQSVNGEPRAVPRLRGPLAEGQDAAANGLEPSSVAAPAQAHGEQRHGPKSPRTRLRRWWRKKWFRTQRWAEPYLTPLRRKDLPAWRAFFWDVAFSRAFNEAMTGLILANTVTLALEHAGMSKGFLATLDLINLGLTGGFILEFLIKHLGCGLVMYWRDPWNLLDAAIVGSSIVSVASGLAACPGAFSNDKPCPDWQRWRSSAEGHLPWQRSAD